MDSTTTTHQTTEQLQAAEDFIHKVLDREGVHLEIHIAEGHIKSENKGKAYVRIIGLSGLLCSVDQFPLEPSTLCQVLQQIDKQKNAATAAWTRLSKWAS